MAMKNNPKLKEELTWHFKCNMGNLTNFDLENFEALENLKNFLFNWPLSPKYIMFELKKNRGVMFNGTED